MKLPWAPRKQGHQARTLKDYFQQLQLQCALLHTELHSPTLAGWLPLYVKRGHVSSASKLGNYSKNEKKISFKACANSFFGALNLHITTHEMSYESA